MQKEQFYDTQFASFATGLAAELGRDAYGENIGQNGWLSAAEFRRFFEWLQVSPTARILDVACGTGGPALYMASTTDCHVTGIDINATGLAAARSMARANDLESRTDFQRVDASQGLPFADNSFDGIVCTDAINHLPDRPRVLAEWRRILRPGGRLVFTNPITVTGLLTSDEIAFRSSIGFFLYTPVGEDERLLQAAGYTVLHVEDSTERVATNAFSMRDARERHRAAVVAEEGVDLFETKQRLFQLAGTLAQERRLSRFTFVAEKPA